MKKLTIIGFTIALLIAAFLLSRQHLKSSHDESVRKLLVGAWTLDSARSFAAQPDGTCVWIYTNPAGRAVTNEGTFQVSDGYIYDTVTKSAGTNMPRPLTTHSWIVRADANEIVVDGDPGGNIQHVFRRETR